MPERYDDILVVDLLGGIGDLIMVLPVIHGLARHHPAAHVRVLTHQSGASLISDDPLIDEVVVPAHAEPGAEREAVEAALAARPPSLAVTTTRYDGIPDLLRSAASRCVDDLWRTPPADQGVSERYLSILTAEGLLPAEDADARPRLHLCRSARRRGHALLASLAPERDAHPVVLVPDAGMDVKRWPARHWRDLAGLLQAEGETVLVVGDVADLPGVRRVPAVSLYDLAAFFSAVADADGVVVGGDTGPLRVADATGAATIGLFGPTAASRYGIPGGTDLQGLPRCPHRRPTAITEQVCWWAAECPLSPREPACMAVLTPEAVFFAARHRPARPRTSMHMPTWSGTDVTA